MRHIKKANVGNIRSLDVAIKNNGIPQDSEAATRAWGNFKDTGQQLFATRLTEQFGLCCYTELNLADLKKIHGIGSHFEHEQPKHLYPQRTFDETNLLRCALDSDDLSVYPADDRFGGHFKDSNGKLSYDPAKFISPQDPSCRDYFVYLIADGSMQPNASLSPNQHLKGEYTINFLNLNAPFLKAERKRWLQEIDHEMSELFKLDDPKQALRALAECELTLTNFEHPELKKPAFLQLRSFHSAVRALFGQLGESVIQQHCPQID
ncbi:MAG: TIGR02646 family protein [Shewanella sp.]|nr:TIGR02646 family protein [Shewanella sp.]